MRLLIISFFLLFIVNHAKCSEFQIPFQNIRGTIIIDVNIGGNNYPMLFDCGATMCITPQLWQELQLKEIKSETYNDSQGNKVTSKRAFIPPMSIAGKQYEGLSAMLLDIENIPGMNCYGIYGVIGPEVIGSSIWQIDFKNRTITISDSATYNTDEYASVPLIKRFYGQPWFYLKTENGDSILTCFDTGSNGYLNINRNSVSSDFTKKASLIYYEYGFTGSGGGGYGRLDTVRHVVSEKGIYIGEYNLKNAYINLHNKPSNIMGTGIMQNFITILDYRNNKILFKPNAASSARKGKSASYKKITFGYSKGHIIAASIRGKTKYDFPPIQAGSIITAINGQQIPSPAQPSDLCSLLTYHYKDSIIQSITIINESGQEQEVRL